MTLSELKALFDIVKSICTILAIIIGGIWAYFKFINKREKYPRASITHKIYENNLPNNKKLIHLFIEVKNIGDVLLSPVYYDVRVLQVIPLNDGLANNLSINEKLVSKGETEISWPSLREYQNPIEKDYIQIEPFEKEDFNFDLIVDGNIKTIQIYSYFKNEKKTDREIGWNLTTFHDLK